MSKDVVRQNRPLLFSNPALGALAETFFPLKGAVFGPKDRGFEIVPRSECPADRDGYLVPFEAQFPFPSPGRDGLHLNVETP